MRRNKKAALELSVNAIVILILAIVMLGLGLGFIRGMFSKVSTQFDEQITTEPEPPRATGSEPITLSRESIVTRAKDAEVLKVSIYNPTNADLGGGLVYCPDISMIVGVLAADNTNRYDICDTGTGCNFTDMNGALPTGDVCNPTVATGPTACPANAKLILVGGDDAPGTYLRKRICESTGCTFADASTFAAADDTCTNTAGGVSPILSCSDGSLIATSDVNSRIIPQGESQEFNYLFTVGNVGPGTSLCEVSVLDYTKDLTIRVTN